MSQARTLNTVALPDALARVADARIDACFESAKSAGVALAEKALWPGDARRVFA
ncbi:MAG: hypothetical protein GTO67_12135, partial [Gammaproteobacteria bacterium]|nr:hypothetical protein [Gammaproteobacteria bacterium]NIT17066.1 hypothetical protein [Gammaproteobacteria bacterium]